MMRMHHLLHLLQLPVGPGGAYGSSAAFTRLPDGRWVLGTIGEVQLNLPSPFSPPPGPATGVCSATAAASAPSWAQGTGAARGTTTTWCGWSSVGGSGLCITGYLVDCCRPPRLQCAECASKPDAHQAAPFDVIGAGEEQGQQVANSLNDPYIRESSLSDLFEL